MNSKVILAGMLAVISFSTFAGTSATLNLKGTVVAASQISVVADSSAQTLDIVNGTSALKIATVSETSNDTNGYDITMSSLNAGKLVSAMDATKSTDYKISYNGLASVSPTTAAAVIKTVSSLTGLTTVTNDVKIDVTAYPTAAAGDYSDTITFSIASK